MFRRNDTGVGNLTSSIAKAMTAALLETKRATSSPMQDNQGSSSGLHAKGSVGPAADVPGVRGMFLPGH